MPKKGYKFGPETRAKMSAAHKGKKRPNLYKDPKKFLVERSEKPNGVSGCWLWTGSLFARTGYGQVTHKGVTHRAHRLSWTTFVGPIPDRLHVLHKCDNRRCVNPLHLFLGTNKDNMDDMRAKGRENFPNGIRCRSAKMTDEKVRTARRLWREGVKVKKLAEMYGLCEQTMYCLLYRKTWKHVE